MGDDGGSRVVRALSECGDDAACLAARGVHTRPCAAAPDECRVQGWSTVFYVTGGCAVEHAPMHAKPTTR